MNSVSAVFSQTFPNPERNLIDACRQGDQRAQLQIYKIYFKQVFNACFMAVPDQVKAEEVMHEVILALLEEIRSSQDTIVFSELLEKILNKTLTAESGVAGSSASNFNVSRN